MPTMSRTHPRATLRDLVACAGALMLASCAGGGGGAALGLLPSKIIEGIAKASEPPPPPDPPETALGWNVVVTDDLVRWRECTALDACGHVERSRRVDELVGAAHVAQTTVGGRPIDVIKLSFPPRPKP